MRIAAAGNVEVPAYLVLEKKGYEISCENDVWTAIKGDLEVVGDGPVELLGLASVHESRGDRWKATDLEIDDFLTKFAQT